tara:strand:- start:12358 stop:14136 length:1779 start_codon:yes stop_codon:yes gene_type:complete
MARTKINGDQIQANSIDTAHIADNQVTLAKMAGLAATKFILGNGDGDPAAVSMSGDATMANNGAVTIANNAVSLAKMAGLARGKFIYGDASGDPAALDVGSAHQFLQHDGTDLAWVSMSGDVTLSAGVATIANGAVEQTMIANDAVGADQLDSDAVVNASVASGAAIAFSKMENVTSGRIIVGNGSNVPTAVALSGDASLANTGAITVTGASGDFAVTGNLTAANLTVNGTTTTVNSTTVTIDDPIFTLGGDTAPGSDDNKDRGIEFRWHDGSNAKIGFFGYDDSASKLTFIPDATNTGEVFTGDAGNVIFGNIEGTITTATQNSITTATGLASIGTITNGTWQGTDVGVAHGGTGASTAANARSNLGLAIGSNVQAFDDGLNSIAGLTTAANKMIYTTDSDTYAVADLTAAGRALLDDANADAQLVTLGLTANATELNVMDGSVTPTGPNGVTAAFTDGLILNDGGTMKQVTVDVIASLLFSSEYWQRIEVDVASANTGNNSVSGNKSTISCGNVTLFPSFSSIGNATAGAHDAAAIVAMQHVFQIYVNGLHQAQGEDWEAVYYDSNNLKIQFSYELDNSDHIIIHSGKGS